MAQREPELVCFGRALRELGSGAGLTQEELAHASGLHPTYISGIEGGHRNLSWMNVCRLSSALGIRPSELAARAERPDGV